VLCGDGAAVDGGGLIACDFDLHKPGAVEGRAELEALGALPRTFTVQTVRGGEHRFYRTPRGVRVANGVNRLRVGGDVRGEHGYVVGAGSYVIDPEEGYAGGYSVVDASPVAPVAPALLMRLGAPRERRSEAADTPHCEPDLPGNVELARHYLRHDAPPAVEGKGGDATTYLVACQVRAYGVSETATFDLMREEYNPRCEPPWENDELACKVENAHRYAQDVFGADTPQALYAGMDMAQFEIAAAPAAPTPKPPPSPRRFMLLDMDAVRRRRASQYRVKGLIPRTGLVVVWGAPKSGKSFVIVDLFAHVAFGWRYRERRVNQGVVVYCALEGVAGLSTRLEALWQAKIAGEGQQVDASAFKIMAGSLALVSDCKAFMQAVADQLGAENPPAVVVVDTLNRSFEGSESEDKAMTAYVRAATAIIERFGCAVVIVHHCGHNETRMRGHTALKGALDIEIRVDRDSASNVIAKVVDAKDIRAGTEIVSRLEVVSVGVDEDGDPIESCVVEPADATMGDAEGVRTVIDCFAEMLAADPVAAPGGQSLGVREKALRDGFRAAWRSTRGASDDAANRAYRRARGRLENEGRLAILPGGIAVSEPSNEGRNAAVSF